MAKLKSDVSTEATVEQIQDTETRVVESNNIPEFVDNVLKLYPQYAKLAVDVQGGVYTEGTQHLSKNNAILYKNPYYKQ